MLQVGWCSRNLSVDGLNRPVTVYPVDEQSSTEIKYEEHATLASIVEASSELCTTLHYIIGLQILVHLQS